MYFYKDVYINPESNTFTKDQKTYEFLAVKENSLYLAKDGTLSGTIVYQIKEVGENSTTQIELANVKPVSPTVKEIGFIFNDGEEAQVDDTVWCKNVLLNKTYSYSITDDQPYFNDDNFGGEINEIYDDNGKITGLKVTLKIKGLKKFSSAQNGVVLTNKQEVVLDTEEKLDSYWLMVQAANESGYSFDGMKQNPTLGDTVISGLVSLESNIVNLIPFQNTLPNAGNIWYKYNPIDGDKFQIEIIKKYNHYGDWEITKALYYVNLQVGHWYNLALTRTSLSGTNSMEFTLTDVDDAINVTDVNNKSTWLFPININNTKFIEGLNPTCSIPKDKISKEISSGMENFKSRYAIEFDSCGRSQYDQVYYVKDQTYYSTWTNADNFTKDDYVNMNLEGKGVTRISNILSGICDLRTGEFFNDKGSFKICANDDLSDFGKQNELFGIIETDDEQKNFVTNYTPRKILMNGQSDLYWTVIERDSDYHVENIPGIQIGSVMYVSTPDLSTNGIYYDMPNNSLAKLKEYEEYFGNPQHRLPPVTLTNRILDSNYATMVYDAVENVTGYRDLETSEDGTVYSYVNNPNLIAYVWNNSKVTRNESIINSKVRTNTLAWTRSNFSEYTAENGSIYNYTNYSDSSAGFVNITADSPFSRQTTIWPVLGNPLSVEIRTDGTAAITATEKIIATAALGFNDNGYPLNCMMVYNANGCVKVNTDRTTYLYLEQTENQNSVKFGCTEEKPAYVESVEGNNAAYAERFEFIPNPTISENLTAEGYDSKLVEYSMGNSSELETDEINSNFFEEGDSDNLTAIDGLKYFAVNSQFKTYSVFDNDNQLITNYSEGSSSTNSKSTVYMTNRLGMAVTTNTETVRSTSFNVVYNPDKFKNLDLVDQLEDKCWKTMNCFYFDGKLVPDTIGNNSTGFTSIVGLNETEENSNSNAILPVFSAKDSGYEIEPAMAIIWMDKLNKPTSDQLNSIPENATGHAIFDKFMSCNLTGLKLTVKQEHLSSAPVWIKVYLLKYDDKIGFNWINDEILDIDLRDDYSNTWSGSLDKSIDKQFIMLPNNLDLTKNVFGIKFVIKQVVPQNDKFNPCIIDDIRIYAANKLNKYGQSRSVDDRFIRKADAAYRDFYDIDVKEYTWRLPSTRSEWSTLGEILKQDSANNQEYIDNSAWGVISSVVDNLANSANNDSIETQLKQTGTNFSFLNTYYITDGSGEYNSGDGIPMVISDNYVSTGSDEIKVTWKYIDWVKISYSSNSDNSKYLLDKYFGNSIYSAMRTKLKYNITTMKENSSYDFTGGIAVEENDILTTSENSLAFDWKTSTEITKDWKDVYTTTTYDLKKDYLVTTTSSYQRWHWKKTKKGCHHGPASHPGHWKQVYDNTYTRVGTRTGSIITGTEDITEYTGTEQVGETQSVNMIVANPKYTSVDSWVASFKPSSIRYRID